MYSFPNENASFSIISSKYSTEPYNYWFDNLTIIDVYQNIVTFVILTWLLKIEIYDIVLAFSKRQIEKFIESEKKKKYF